MAIKKEMKAWAVKLRGRNFWVDFHGTPWTFSTRQCAEFHSLAIAQEGKVTAKPVRVKVLVEEV